MIEQDLITDEQDEHLVALQLAGETYGVDISLIHGIIRLQEITRVPHAPDFVEGVTNLRGKVIPVIDLRKRLGLAVSEPTRSTRIVVVEIDSKAVGMVVDGVSEVLRISRGVIEPPSPIVADITAEYLRGVGKVNDRLVILLDLAALLSSAEKVEMETASQQMAA